MVGGDLDPLLAETHYYDRWLKEAGEWMLGREEDLAQFIFLSLPRDNANMTSDEFLDPIVKGKSADIAWLLGF